MTREEWLQERKSGIGGSDAAVILGSNPYKTTIDLWKEKTGRKEAEDISDNLYVKYGTKMEDILRESFKVKHPNYLVTHQENTIIRHPKYSFLFASLDGEILDIATGEQGILEIKTSSPHSRIKSEEWKNRIPENYYCQVLHYLNVTGYAFVKLFAELTYKDLDDNENENYQITRTYTIKRKEVEEDIKYLELKEIEFWKYVEADKEPPLELPQIGKEKLWEK